MQYRLKLRIITPQRTEVAHLSSLKPICVDNDQFSLDTGCFGKFVLKSYQHKGIDLSALPKGTYKLLIEIKLKNNMTDIQEVKSERGFPGLEPGKYKVFCHE